MTMMNSSNTSYITLSGHEYEKGEPDLMFRQNRDVDPRQEEQNTEVCFPSEGVAKNVRLAEYSTLDWIK